MTLTEAYEALMKMPQKNRMPDFKEAGRKEPRKEPEDAKIAGSAADMLGEIFPAQLPFQDHIL
jgi:hypothetical protein